MFYVYIYIFIISNSPSSGFFFVDRSYFILGPSLRPMPETAREPREPGESRVLRNQPPNVMGDTVWVNFITTSRRDRALEIMANKGNHPQMGLIQVSELL